MGKAISAKAQVALGASLIALFSLASAYAAAPERGLNAIGGGDVAGISGGDVLGISGGDVAGISGGDVLGISGGDVAGVSNAILSGPVEKIDTINGIFESMGQFVMASRAMLDGLTVGDLVAVQGSIVSSGWLYADTVVVSSESYVPGATEVSVTGLLSSVDLSRGTARIGDLTVDYNASLSLARAPSTAIWSFRGTRPASNGIMLSDRSSAQ